MKCSAHRSSFSLTARKVRGKASRDFQRWARKYQLKDGEKSRMTLLNNWEATYFDFNEDKLVNIMDEAVALGVDMFFA